MLLGNKVFVIAEIGCNFEDSFERAKEMICAAAVSGADAVKFQTFIPELLVTRTAPKFWDIEGCPGETQFEEFKEMFQFSFEQYTELKELAESKGLVFFSTPNDEQSANMLEQLNIPIYKISSMDITHLPLIEHIAKKGAPIILSTGASTIAEIRDAVETIEAVNREKITLLHCITNYPTAIDNVNLSMITDIKKEFPRCNVGYSDHTKMPHSADIIAAAVAIGAQVIEKHFTFDKLRPGYDHEISADYDDLKAMVASIVVIEKSLCRGQLKMPLPAEEKARKWARRSVVAKKAIQKGETISKDALIIKRPGTGIPPKFLAQTVGKTAKQNILEDQVITYDMIQ